MESHNFPRLLQVLWSVAFIKESSFLSSTTIGYFIFNQFIIFLPGKFKRQPQIKALNVFSTGYSINIMYIEN